MVSSTERRLAALENASESKRIVVVIRGGGHLRGAFEAERAAWLEAWPLYMSGPVLVTYILDDVEGA